VAAQQGLALLRQAFLLLTLLLLEMHLGHLVKLAELLFEVESAMVGASAAGLGDGARLVVLKPTLLKSGAYPLYRLPYLPGRADRRPGWLPS